MKEKPLKNGLYLVIIVSMSLVSISCDSGTNKEAQNNKKLLPTEINLGSVIKFEYDEENRVSKIIYGDESADVCNYSYDSQDRVISDGQCKYEYRDNYILMIDTVFNTIDTLFVNNKNQLIKYAPYNDHLEIINYHFTLYEYDSKGNLVKITTKLQMDDEGKTINSTFVETSMYDNKNGALSNITNASFRIILSRAGLGKFLINNIKGSKTMYKKLKNGILVNKQSDSAKYLYKYNEYDYPESGILTGKGSIRLNILYKEVE